jgi:putative cell wall-binding protein
MSRSRATTRLLCLSAAAVLGAVATAGAAPAPTGRTGASRALTGGTSPGAASRAPALATDPTDPGHVVAVDEQSGRGRCSWRVTFDAGRTWSGGDFAAPAEGPTPCAGDAAGASTHFGQSVAFGSGANVFTTFAAGGPDGGPVLVSRSSDGGRTWQPAVVALPAPPGVVTYLRPRLAVVPRPGDDRVYVSAWTGERHVAAGRSDDGGRSFAAPVDISGAGGPVGEPSAPAVVPGGAVYVAWAGGEGTSTPAGLARSGDGGVTWTTTPGPLTGGDPADGPPSLAADEAGTLFLVDPSVDTGDARHRVLVRRSLDGGATWSAPDPIGSGDARGPVVRVVPRVSVASGGRVDVVWTEWRTDPAPVAPVAALGDVWYAASPDGGRTFSIPRRVTDRSTDGFVGGADSPALTALGPDRVLFAWSDARAGGGQVHTATLDLGAGGPVPATSLPEGSPEDLSVTTSRLAYAGGKGHRPATTVVVVNQDDIPSALAGAVLARAGSSPLLVARATDLTRSQKAEVARLSPTGAYLVGAASALSDTVVASLVRAGAPSPRRINGNDSADTARRVALLLDGRDDAARAAGTPAFDTAVIVNPAAPDAATGSALAATLRLPVLFTQRDTVPPATADALAALAVRSTLVVGGPDSVGAGVVSRLPGAKRLGGTDPTLTSEAVAREAVARGLPANVVYVVDGERPADQATVGAAVARLGGIMLAEPDAGPAEARRSLDKLGLTAGVDRLVVARVDLGGSSTGLRLALAIVIFVIGIAVLMVALVHRDDGGSDAVSPPGTSSPAPPDPPPA